MVCFSLAANESEKMFSSELDTLFEKCDRTNSRRIGEHDFFHIVDEMGGDTLSVDDRAKAFKKIANGESTLSKEKFLTFMEKHMKPMSLDEEIENMFNSMDSDGSKTVRGFNRLPAETSWTLLSHLRPPMTATAAPRRSSRSSSRLLLAAGWKGK